jgi:hypothetical protein
MITFNIPSHVTAHELIAASEVLRALASGLSETKNDFAEAVFVDESTIDSAPFDKFAKDKLAIAKAIKAKEETTKPTIGKVLSTLNLADLDKDGAPYDPEIHATTKGKTAKGVWKMRKGADKELYASRTAANIEFAASINAGTTEPDTIEPDVIDDDEGEDPEDVFGADLGADAPWPTSESVGNVHGKADEPITHAVLMATAISHLTAGEITAVEITAILNDCPGMDGKCAPHLGALSSGMFAGVLDDVKASLELNLSMKGVAW